MNEIVKTRYRGDACAVIGAAESRGIQTDSRYVAAVGLAKLEIGRRR
ncbi:MAG: hypothetical protein HC887_09135 [Desulfobacteraceae bacterium]|nr:hypothetical protein [Desulfobacteraceae bacterium]